MKKIPHTQGCLANFFGGLEHFKSAHFRVSSLPRFVSMDGPRRDHSLLRHPLDIPSLASRRSDADVKFVSGLLDGLVDAPDTIYPEQMFVFPLTSRT